jgi:hypothetical protein
MTRIGGQRLVADLAGLGAKQAEDALELARSMPRIVVMVVWPQRVRMAKNDSIKCL